MKILKAVLFAALFLFLLIVAVYWFNLDTKLVKACGTMTSCRETIGCSFTRKEVVYETR